MLNAADIPLDILLSAKILHIGSISLTDNYVCSQKG